MVLGTVLLLFFTDDMAEDLQLRYCSTRLYLCIVRAVDDDSMATGMVRPFRAAQHEWSGSGFTRGTSIALL